MAGLLDYLKKYEVKENSAVETFLNALEKQIDALSTDKLTRRSWAKPDSNGYKIKLGKLDGTYLVASLGEAQELLAKVSNEARSDADFKALIEAAYGEPLGEEPAVKKTRKPRTLKAAAVDTDVISIPLRRRT